jgi:nucleotide-binding universal stress UspA family protein
VLPLVGAAACLALAVFQGFAVGSAGALATVWIGAGVAFYLTKLAPGARVADATAQARDPDLARLRGRAPLVLVPVANPRSAAGLVSVAQAVVTPSVGRVLLLTIVDTAEGFPVDVKSHPVLVNVQDVIGEGLHASVGKGLAPQALVTFSADRWAEIARVGALHRCETLLLGLSRLDSANLETRVEELMGRVTADVILLRAEPGWDIGKARRVLVPLGGRRDHSVLRARLLASLSRGANRELLFVRTLPPGATEEELDRARRQVQGIAEDEAGGPFEIDVRRADDAAAYLARRAAAHDLVILGTRRLGARQKTLGDVPIRLARETDRPLILISRRG